MKRDIIGDPKDPLNFPIQPGLSQRAIRESHRMYAKKLIENIDDKEHGSEGKPLYGSIEEFHFCNEGRFKHNYDKLETKVEYLER